jgi:tetratricopeptide (TPR) repeat protein
VLVVLSLLIVVISLRISTIEKRKEVENHVERLFDDSRFYTDGRSAKMFKKALKMLVETEVIKKINFRKAAKIFDKTARRTSDPLDKAYALGWAGRCYEDYGDFAIAAICYAAAVETAPSDVFALERLGDFYWEADADESAKRYEQVLEYDPLSCRTYYKLGKLYSKRGQSDKAIAFHKTAIEVNNGYVASMAEMAIEYAKKGDKPALLQFFCLAMANDLYEFEKLEGAIKSCF